MPLLEDIRKTMNYAGRNGLRQTWFAAAERLRERRQDHYRYVPPTRSEEELQKTAYKARMDQGENLPLVSFLVPVYRPVQIYFEQMLDSVLGQTYQNYEIVIADASEGHIARSVVDRKNSSRISYHRLDRNYGISGNTNAAAVFAKGEYVAFLDDDDLLTQDALCEVTSCIAQYSPEIVYSDEDKCDEKARRFFEPNKKPDFNQDYFLSNNYICHLLVMKTELFLALGLRSEYDGAQDYDLMLRAPWSNIRHIPKVLYHWRTHEGSTAGNPASKDYAYAAGLLALQDYFRRCRMDVVVRNSRHRGFYDIQYIPDIFTARQEVGVVGGKILDKNRKVVGGMMDAAGKVAFLGFHEMDSGPMHRADTRQDCAAVDVRCMQIRDELRPLYQSVFNASYDTHVMRAGEDDLKLLSLEFCRQVRNRGYLVVWDPAMTFTIS